MHRGGRLARIPCVGCLGYGSRSSQFRLLGGFYCWGMVIDYAVLLDGLAFAEGVRYRDGHLWFSDMHDRTVYRIDAATGEVGARISMPDKPSGIAFTDDGDVLITQMRSRIVAKLCGDGSLVMHADLSPVADWHVNDMTSAPGGGVYVGNFGDASAPPAPAHPARLAHVSATREVSVVAEDMLFANGMVVVDHGATLLVAQTRSVPPEITAFDIDVDGALSRRRSFAQFSGTMMPDGLAATSAGEVLVAMPFANQLVLLDPEGRTLRTYEVDSMPYACATDPGSRMAYACLSSSWEEQDCLSSRDAMVVMFQLD